MSEQKVHDLLALPSIEQKNFERNKERIKLKQTNPNTCTGKLGQEASGQGVQISLITRMGVLPKEQLLSPEYEVDYDRDAMVRSTVILNQPNRADNGINHDENNQDRSTNDTPHVYTIDNIQMGCVYDVLDSMNRWCEGEVSISFTFRSLEL